MRDVTIEPLSRWHGGNFKAKGVSMCVQFHTKGGWGRGQRVTSFSVFSILITFTGVPQTIKIGGFSIFVTGKITRKDELFPVSDRLAVQKRLRS